MTSDLDYVKRMLEDANLSAVAQKVGLAYGTVYRVATSEKNKPSFSTIQKLAEYFRGKQ